MEIREDIKQYEQRGKESAGESDGEGGETENWSTCSSITTRSDRQRWAEWALLGSSS